MTIPFKIQGSITLVLLITMSLVGIIIFGTLQSTLLVNYFAIQRIQISQQNQLAYSLLEYGIQYAHDNFDQISKDKGGTLTLWLPNSRGYIQYESQREIVRIQAFVENASDKALIATAQIKKTNTNQMIVESFQAL